VSSSSPEPLSRTALGLAVGLAVALLVGVILAGVLLSSGDGTTAPAGSTPSGTPRTGPVGLVAIDAPAAGSLECTQLTAALPGELSSGAAVLRRLPIADPAPPATAAWGDAQHDPVVLRCGLNRPSELTRTAALREISGIKWLPVTGNGAATWYAVDRSVYLALTVPDGSGTGPLQAISETVGATLPARSVWPAGG
jgi:Protein of unknown function (DUF3515)